MANGIIVVITPTVAAATTAVAVMRVRLLMFIFVCFSNDLFEFLNCLFSCLMGRFLLVTSQGSLMTVVFFRLLFTGKGSVLLLAHSPLLR